MLCASVIEIDTPGVARFASFCVHGQYGERGYGTSPWPRKLKLEGS